jgi:hypothetical protein
MSSNCECPDCHKILSSEYNLRSHISKGVCHKESRICSKCGKMFRRRENLEYHTKHSVCSTHKPKLVLKKELIQMSREALIDKVTQMETELSQMKCKYETLRENPQIVNNNNIVVFPNAFGSEDMSHIQNKIGDILGPLIKNGRSNYIPRLFHQIHNNDQLPEYHNVYVTSERSCYALVSDGEKFKYCPKKALIDQIIEDKRSLINQYVDNNGDQLGEKVLQKYDMYQNKIDDNPEFKKDLEQEIGCMLLNMKSVIANDAKTAHLLELIENP